MNAPVASVRARSMQQRRDRILAAARQLIARGGFEALNLRALANAAEVTVPTIYNLVGNKEELVVALFDEALSEIEQRVSSHRGASPLERAEAVVTESIDVFAADEDFYRAAFIALEYLDQNATHHHAAQQLFDWGERMLLAGCAACHSAGLLRGHVPTTLLSAQVLRCYRSSSRAWALGQIDIAEFRATALADLHVCLAADAVERFRTTLLDALSHCAMTGQPTSSIQHSRTGENTP